MRSLRFTLFFNFASGLWIAIQPASAILAEDAMPSFTVERSIARHGFDGKTCWVHARAGSIPAKSMNRDQPSPLVVMTLQKLLLSGSDVFYELHEMRSSDLGQRWTAPSPQTNFARADLSDNREMTVCDFTPKWHAATRQLLGTGHTVVYKDNRVMKVRPRRTAYATFDLETWSWKPWRSLKMPANSKFENAGAGSVQRYDLPNGDVLLPIYFKSPEATRYSVSVVRCSFDGESLAYEEHGNEMTIPVKRGLFEPSLTRFEERFYMTLRNDEQGYVCQSPDGLQFSEPIPWRFDDGEPLGNYNTQQHWVTHSDGLFLVYTRRGLQNDHVFRHRAPLMIARVDPKTMSVIRRSEHELVRERGARLGNFGVVDVSPNETWVTVAEWMQPTGVEKHGSDNSLHVVKLKWNSPNQLVD